MLQRGARGYMIGALQGRGVGLAGLLAGQMVEVEHKAQSIASSLSRGSASRAVNMENMMELLYRVLYSTGLDLSKRSNSERDS